jgi:predicted N-formylglutamate amidohydrolase
MKPIAVVLSCEHAVNAIPEAYRHYFSDNEALLNTHRGLDFGAQAIAFALSQSLQIELASATVSRLLIDCNRCLSHPECFSTMSAKLSSFEKNQVIEQYYLPFRQQVESRIKTHLTRGYQVWHLSIHSFTPLFKGVIRKAEFGLLYDPKRLAEKAMAKSWQALLKKHTQDWRVYLNYPYKGYINGFTTHLRTQYSDSDYLGIELEVNQALTLDTIALAQAITLLKTTLKMMLEQ